MKVVLHFRLLAVFLGVGIAGGCDKRTSTTAAGPTPLSITIDQTKGKTTLASVGWPASAGSNRMWLTEEDGVATIKLAEGEVQTFEFSGLTMLAYGGEVSAIEFRMPDEPFDDAYKRAKAMAEQYNLGPMKNLEDWYLLRRPHHLPMTSGVGRKIDGVGFGISVGVIAIPKSQAYVKMSYNFRVIERAAENGTALTR